jgi:putative redox protein
MGTTTVSANLGNQNYHTRITNSRHTIMGDEPVHIGGQDLGPNPYEFVLAGLAMCKAATLRMYAARKGWDLGEIQVDVALEEAEGHPPHFVSSIHFAQPITEEQRQRLLVIADKCPTHKLLAGHKNFSTSNS